MNPNSSHLPALFLGVLAIGAFAGRGAALAEDGMPARTDHSVRLADERTMVVSGCVASRLASRRGGAPSAALCSANASNGSDTDVTQAADWIVGHNIDVGNMSFGGGYIDVLQYKDRYFDFHSRVDADSYVASAGSGDSCVDGFGIAWSYISVGSFADSDDSLGRGDRMCGSCEGRNPWTDARTSFGAPLTAAALAVSMALDSTARVSLEAALALTMPTAWHHIERASRLSSRDGRCTGSAGRLGNRDDPS